MSLNALLVPISRRCAASSPETNRTSSLGTSSDTIGDHAEPLPVADDLRQDLFYRGLRAFPAISAYARVSAMISVTPRLPDSPLVRKRRGRSRLVLAMHETTAWSAVGSAMVRIVSDAESASQKGVHFRSSSA